MKIKDADARNLLQACGFATADSFPAKRVAAKIQQLPKLEADLETRPEAGSKEASLLEELLEAAKEGDAIEIAPSEAAEAPAKGGKGKAAAKPPAKGKASNREAGPSMKGLVYQAWQKSKRKATAEDLIKVAKGKVKDSTVKSWLSAWGRGQNLPAAAK